MHSKKFVYFLAAVTTTAFLPVSYTFAEPKIANCSVFPANNIWNTPIDTLPADPNPQHQAWIDAVGRNTRFHMDFGADLYEGDLIGIPYNVVRRSTLAQCSPFTFYDRINESDKGGIGCYLDGPTMPPSGYAIPDNPILEGGHDRHLISVDTDNCVAYEVFLATYDTKTHTGTGDNGVAWSLNSNMLRPKNWVSADAAGLSILAGLVRYEEAKTGTISHALRFTVPRTDGTFIWPARHKTDTGYVSSPGVPAPPPFGARLRLKKNYSHPFLETFPEMRAIIKAMQTYGIINADNGSPWFITGAPDLNWNDERLRVLADSLTGNDFEVVDTSCMMVNEDSAQADISRCTTTPTAVPSPTPTAIATITTTPAPTPTPVAGNCSYTLNANTGNFTQTGGKGLISVMASNSGCAWTVNAQENSGVSLVSSMFTGTETVNYYTGSREFSYLVAANNAPSGRSMTLSVAGLPFFITQQGINSEVTSTPSPAPTTTPSPSATPTPPNQTECTYQVTSGSNYFSQTGGNGLFNVTASASHCSWAVSVAQDSGISVAGTQFTGSRELIYNVAPNNTVNLRSSTLSVAGQQFLVVQQGITPKAPDCTK